MTRELKLRIARLTLTDFRNYAGARLETDASLIALAGSNGAGKTNLLEAISLLAPGRGLRGAAYEELARLEGKSAWAIAADLHTPEGSVSLGTGWSGQNEANDASQSRLVIINGKAQKSSGTLGQYMRLLWLTPAMDRLFQGSASDRRRFLDRLVQAVDPEHGSRVSVFEKVMRERNLLLEENHPDSTWISSLEAHMAEAAVAIAAARISALEALRRHIQEARESSPFPWSRVDVEGEIEGLLATIPAVRVEDEYRIMLRDSRGLDRAAGRTLRGPHRSDFEVVHGPKNTPAGSASTGEQKALLIGLILAEARAVKELTGASPVLLLDEVAAHLDRQRRMALFASLRSLGCQAWMTGTDVSLFEGLGNDAALFHVEEARISEAKKT